MASTHEHIQFLRARYGEEEALARVADGDEIEATASLWDTKYLTLRGDRDPRHTAELPAALADHIARHDPAHVLREVAAKRRVLDAWEDIDYDVPDYVIDALAAVYSDHPDYPK